jgi:hypothetical protein
LPSGLVTKIRVHLARWLAPGREPVIVPGDAIGEERPGHLPVSAACGVVVRSGTSGARLTEARSDVRAAAQAASMEASAISLPV